MDYEMSSQVHEITQYVNLTDSPRTLKTDRGLTFFPRHISIYWIQENAGAWELMSTTVKGKLRRTDGTPGLNDGSRCYWASAKHLPGWIGEIVEKETPIEVRISREEA